MKCGDDVWVSYIPRVGESDARKTRRQRGGSRRGEARGQGSSYARATT